MRILAISLACAASIFAAQPVFAAPISRIVAVVNGDMITSRDLEKAVKPEFLGQQIDPQKSPELADMVRRAVLDNMINEKIIRQQAAKDKIEVTEEQIDGSLDIMVKEMQMTREQFFSQMAKDGFTEKMLRDKAAMQILTQRVMNQNVVRKVVVTEEEVNDYYRKHMVSLATSRYRVAMLIYPGDVDAQKWADDIASGKVSFADAARKVSVGPNPEEGGDLGFLEVADMAPGMAQVVSGMGKGDISPLLNVGPSQIQVAVLDVEAPEVDEKAEAKPDEDTARRIEEILRRPRLQERLQQYTTELRQKALVDIRL